MLRQCILLGLLLATACARTETPAPEVSPSSVDCGAAGYQAMVGAQLAAVTMPAGLNMEIVEYGAAPPMPADPARMIFELDADGRIARVYCG